jgi:PA14 domain-containing protein/dolichyl-phosphate-mannose-protein mannosyltransferase
MEGGSARPLRARQGFQIAILYLTAFAMLGLLAPRGGLVAVTSVEKDSGATVPLHSRIDPLIDFPTPHLLEAPLFQHWNLTALGFPADIPTFQVRWTGFILSPVSGEYRFLVQAAGQFRLLIDGRPLILSPVREEEGMKAALSEGWHPLEVTYRRSEGDAQIRLLWQPPGTSTPQVVPREDLAPTSSAIRGRLTLRLLGGFLAAGWLLAILRVWKRRDRPGSLGDAIRAHHRGVALAGILAVAFLLRWYQFDLIPFHHETADEYQHGWEGWTLLHEGEPTAWTFYPQYYPPDSIRSVRWFGDPYHLARPYFDHPPGFSLLVGAASTLMGARQMWDCTLARMRWVPLLLGLLTTALVARAGWALLDPLAGTLAALLYATLPTLVLGNRLVKAENLLAPVLLAQTLWLERYLREGRRAELLKTALGIVAAIWAKATGVAVPLAAALIMAPARRWREISMMAGAAAAALIAYLIYGAVFGWEIFTRILGLQASKAIALRTALDLAGISRIVELQFGGGWYLWLALATATMAMGKHRRLLAPAAVYFAILVATADVRGVYGWYRLPLYPYLCLAGGLMLADWWKEKDPARGFLFAATAVAATLSMALPGTAEQSRLTVVLIFGIAGLPAVWHAVWPSLWSARIRSVAVLLVLAAFFLGNVAVTARQVPIYLQEGVRGKVPETAPLPGR